MHKKGSEMKEIQMENQGKARMLNTSSSGGILNSDFISPSCYFSNELSS